MAKATTKSKATNTKREPRTVKLTTIIWTVAVLAALIAGFYSGVTVRNAYAKSVSTEAKALVKELKLNEQK